jgi:hypothetical protein
MYRFLIPAAGNSVIEVEIDGASVEQAFEEYRRLHWNPGTTIPLAVWRDGNLCGRVVPVLNAATGHYEPIFQVWP